MVYYWSLFRFAFDVRTNEVEKTFMIILIGFWFLSVHYTFFFSYEQSRASIVYMQRGQFVLAINVSFCVWHFFFLSLTFDIFVAICAIQSIFFMLFKCCMYALQVTKNEIKTHYLLSISVISFHFVSVFNSSSFIYVNLFFSFSMIHTILRYL